jgi:hypothetical protein
MGWAEHVARIGQNINYFKFWLENLKKGHLQDLSEDGILSELQTFMDLSYDRAQRPGSCAKITKYRALEN